VPFKEEFDCDVSGRNLVALRSQVIGPMIFACLDPEAPPFETWSGDLRQAFERTGITRWEPAYQYDYTVQTNWKTYVENGLDGYHIPFVHDVLRDAIDLGTGRNTFEPHSSYTLVDGSGMFPAPEGVSLQFRFGHLFRNIIPVLTPIDFSYLRIDPVGPETVRLRRRGFDGGVELPVPGEFRSAAFHATKQQDIAVVERVQRGLRARGLPSAVHGIPREERVTHFERLVQAAMSR
jgi:choline monooxygenase